LGSAVVQLGPNVLGPAAELHHELGVSYGRGTRFLHLTLGLDAGGSSFARTDCFLAYEPLTGDFATRLMR